jgi:hypothetical protein
VSELPKSNGGCDAGYHPIGEIEDICAKEAGFATVDRKCDPKKGFFQSRLCEADEGTYVFSLWDHNYKSETCYVGQDGALVTYRPYDWCGCPGAAESSFCYAFFTADVTREAQEAGSIATCSELGKDTVFTSQPPASSSRGFSATTAQKLVGPSNVVAGGSGLAVSGAAVLGFAFMKMKKKKAGPPHVKLEMTGAGRV